MLPFVPDVPSEVLDLDHFCPLNSIFIQAGSYRSYRRIIVSSLSPFPVSIAMSLFLAMIRLFQKWNRADPNV